MAVLELHSIHKSFRQGFWGVRTPVLRGVDLSVEAGEVYGFLGHNGAGKSTTMKVILGLLRPERGEVRIFGEAGASERTRARIGYLGEDVGLYPTMTAPQMLALAAELFRLPRALARARTENLLDQVGLSGKESIRTKNYSKGMRQRLGLAIALVNDPELLILDEPYSGLDPIGRKELRELLVSLRARGKTILMSSHVVPDVEAVCDRVGILSGGVIARLMNLNEIQSAQAHALEVTIAGVDAGRICARDYGAHEVPARDGALTLRMSDDHRLKSLIDDVYAARGTVAEVRPLRTGLEDAFVDAVVRATAPAPAAAPAAPRTQPETEWSRR